MAGANEAAIGLLVDLGPQLERDLPYRRGTAELSTRKGGSLGARTAYRAPQVRNAWMIRTVAAAAAAISCSSSAELDFDCGRSVSFRKLAPNGSEFVVNYPSRRMIGLKTYSTRG